MNALASTHYGLARLLTMGGLPSSESFDGVDIRPCGWQVRPGKYRLPVDKQLIRVNRVDYHVALKVISAHASGKIEAGWLREDDLRKITNASPLHHGVAHFIRLPHEFAFEFRWSA